MFDAQRLSGRNLLYSLKKFLHLFSKESPLCFDNECSDNVPDVFRMKKFLTKVATRYLRRKN